MMNGKNKLTHPKSRALLAIFGKLSKNAIIDLLGDLLDLNDPEWQIHDVIEFAAPRLRIREEKEPDSWKEGTLRRLPIHKELK